MTRQIGQLFGKLQTCSMKKFKILKVNQKNYQSLQYIKSISSKMKTKYKPTLLALFLVIVLLGQSHCQQSPPQPVKNETTPNPQPEKQQPKPLDHVPIELDKPYPQQLSANNSFSQKYRVKISPEKVNTLNQTKWYFFVDVQTTEEFEWQKTKIQLFSVNEAGNQKPLKQCDTQSGLDSCFLTNNNFDYKTESIQARVTCEEYCKFTLSAEISAKYKLQIDKPVELDFQNTAYSKLFTVDTSSLFDFKRLQIILRPKGFLNFNAPIRMYANQGDAIPTREKHDFAGIHLWDDGQGIFINYPQGAGIFTVLIEGPEKNVLILEAKVIYESKPITTTRYEPSFAYLQAQQKQVFQIPINKSEHTFIKLTTLTGSIQLNKVRDQSQNDMQIQFTPLSRSYGQLQYKFEPAFYQTNKQFNITDKLYIEIKANKDSTFVFESYTNNDEMSYLASEVNRYSDLQQGGIDMYYMRLYQLQDNVSDKNKAARIQVMTTTYDYIDLNTRFILCKAKEAKECQPTTEQIQKLKKSQSIDNQKRKQLQNTTSDTSVAGVKYHDISIEYSQFVKNQNLLHIYVIFVIINPKPDEQILYTLQYIDMGSTYFLKEKQLKRDRVAIDEIKYYTFVNNDKDVKSIKIHSIQISGQILMVGYKEDPREKEVEGKEVYEYHGSVTFLNVLPGEQFYLMVQGVDNAYYSLYLQLIRESESRPDQKGGNEGYNQIIIQDNIMYDFFIKPKESMIIQMHATQSNFDLIIGSHLPLELCMTENIDKPPFKPNCEIKQTLTKNERMGIRMDRGLIGNIGVTNNNDKAVEFKIEMKTAQKQTQCKQSCPGMMNKFSLQAGQNSTNSTEKPSNSTEKKTQCYKLNLSRRENIEIMVELENMLYDNTTIYWQLNDKEKEVMLESRHLIWKKELVKVCGQESEKSACELIITIESNYSTDGVMLVQYLDKDLILLDGIAQPSFTDQKSPEPKHFRYQMINLVNTTILLQNKVGYYHFYGSVVSRVEFMKSSNRSLLYPNEKQHLFKSENPFYYVFQTYVLTDEQLKNPTCKQECVLLISVYPGKNEHSSDEMGRFIIEISQEDRFLKQNQPIMGYLQRGSIAFYEYYHPTNGTIYLQLNNQNMHCAKIFIKKGNQTRATPSSYDKMADENSLIYEQAPAGPYAIAVEAKHFGCSYTIQAVSSIVHIQKIKRGTFSDKTLQQNQTFHLLYEHFRNQSFKILTLNKVGELMLKLKVLYDNDLNNLLTANSSQSLSQYLSNLTYQQTGVDFIKVHHQKSLYFCTNCTYLISITANKYTQTSVIIPSRDVEIPIITNALIKDEVKLNETVKYRIFTSNIAKYQINVQYGQINLTIVESISNKQVHTKVYNQTKQPIYESFNSSSGGDNSGKAYGYDFIHYSVITIEGLANSSFYSFELLSSQDQKKQGNVKYGIPEYFFLQTNKTKCFKGLIDDDSEQFILSFDDSNIQTVKALSIDAKVNDKKVAYKTTYGVSEMTLEINDLKLNEPTSFEICLVSKETVSLTFIQSAHIMMIPSDTSVLLTHPTNVTFGSKGYTILEVDECSTRSIISISSTFNDLHTSDSQIQQVHRANNLIEFNHWGPVYVHIETEGTRLRWRHKDTYSDSGMGYDKFVGGTANAFKEGDNIKIEAKPIQQIGSYSKNTTMKINSVTYKVILGRYEKQLLTSLNCQEGNVLKYEHQTSDLKNSAIATFPITQDMKKRFSELRFFLAGVIANLNIQVNGVIENYRFVYPIVQIQREVFSGGDVRPVEDSSITRDDTRRDDRGDSGVGYLLIMVGGIVLLAASYCIYTKWIRSCMRSRRQKLADQGSASFKYTEFASMND